jgi:glyoxylase-like metal-dependent hydrolase (beta-lactamase superfamily II)
MDVPRLTIGTATVYFLNDGFWWDDGGAMFGPVPKTLWERDRPSDDRNRIHMSLVCPLVVADGEVVLVDTGIGDRLEEKDCSIYHPERGAGLAGALALIGLAPDDVTTVILSHLHFDHCGGLIRRTDGGHTPAFPRARHIIQRREWDVALHPPDARQAAAYRHAPECLAPLAGDRLHLIDGLATITPAVRVYPSGGHTPAHQCVIVESGGQGLVHLADLAPTTSHLRPTWVAAYDLDPLQVLEARQCLLHEIMTKGWWVSFDHDDRIASGRLTGDAARPAVIDPIATPPPAPGG